MISLFALFIIAHQDIIVKYFSEKTTFSPSLSRDLFKKLLTNRSCCVIIQIVSKH